MTFHSLAAALTSILLVGTALAQEPPVASIIKPVFDSDGHAGFSELLSRGYRPLFNRHDLTGERNPYPHGEARVVDGEIHLLANEKFFLVIDRK
jgi:hypothetical protein